MTERPPDAAKLLQVRVPKEYADKVAALARAQGKTMGQLMRDAMDALIEDAQHSVEGLQLEFERRFQQEQAAATKTQLDGSGGFEHAVRNEK
jgi:predicted DNA-binding protein